MEWVAGLGARILRDHQARRAGRSAAHGRRDGVLLDDDRFGAPRAREHLRDPAVEAEHRIQFLDNI